jgi:hypothetical protein
MNSDKSDNPSIYQYDLHDSENYKSGIVTY